MSLFLHDIVPTYLIVEFAPLGLVAMQATALNGGTLSYRFVNSTNASAWFALLGDGSLVQTAYLSYGLAVAATGSNVLRLFVQAVDSSGVPSQSKPPRDVALQGETTVCVVNRR